MGIPQNADIEKRNVARKLLSDHPEFASIFFLTPTGDLYLGEPFDQQKQLPKLNYADSDWYQGVSSTAASYVSLAFVSAAIHVPAVAIALPVIDQIQTVGYWVGILSWDQIKSSLKAINTQSRVLLVDHNGTEVVDTGRAGEVSELRSFATLKSVQGAFAAKSGTIVERVDGVEMKARFAPVNTHPNTWAIVFLEPVD